LGHIRITCGFRCERLARRLRFFGQPEGLLFADAKTPEYLAQKVVCAELAGDFVECLLG
jgi:hypothetical protein